MTKFAYAGRALARAFLVAAVTVFGGTGVARAQAAEEVPAEGTVSLRAVVTDVEGGPIGGAGVVVRDGADVLVEGVTAADGTLALADVPARELTIDVSADGRFPATGTLYAGSRDDYARDDRGPRVFRRTWIPIFDAGDDEPSVEIALVSVTNVVVPGAPPGARVTARAISASKEFGDHVTTVFSGDEHLLGVFEATADESGQCRFDGVPERSTLIVRVEKPGSYVPVVARAIHAGDSTVGVLPEGVPAWEIRGTVLGLDSQPLSGALVVLAPTGSPPALADPSKPPESQGRDDSDVVLAWTTETDAAGEFSFPSLSPHRRYAVRARGGGELGSPTRWEIGPTEDLASVDVVLVVERTVSIAGVVIDSEGVRPPRGQIALRTLPRDDGQRRKAVFDDGKFAFSDLIPGRYVFVIEGEGVRRTVREIDLRLGSGPLRIEVDAGMVITGRLEDLDGNPIADASVGAFDPAAEAQQVIRYPIGEQMTTTDDEGRFRLAGLTEQTWNLRTSSTEGRAAICVATPAPATDVVLRTGEPPRLQFSIALPEGIGMQDVRLGVFRLVGDGTPYAAGEWDREQLTQTQAAFRDLPADQDLIVRFVVPGHPPYEQTLRLAPGESRDLGELAIPESLTIEGVVRDSAGEPVGGVTVRADLCAGGAVETDAEGQFRLENVAAGEQWFHARSFSNGRSVTGEKHVSIPAKGPVELVVLRHPTVTGRVVSDRGEPVAGNIRFLAVRPWGRLARPRDTGADAAGDFWIQLAPGPYRIFVAPADGTASRFVQTVEIVEAPTESLEIKLRRGN